MNNTSSARGSLGPIIVKLVLASFDFVLFSLGPVIAAGLVYLLWSNFYAYIPEDEITSRLTAHILLALLCVGWFWLRLRHYSYRKTFWFELKEIIRTVLIFAVIDLAIVAFSKWHLSRYIWIFTWSSVLFLMPLGRLIAKKLLNTLKLWKTPSIIIGTGKNAQDAYKAISSEKDLGFDIQYFFSTNDKEQLNTLFDIPVINDTSTFWRITSPKDTQFFVALEFEEEAQRDLWIRNLATRSCRAVSIIPSTRGVPLNSTDMSFIFSHEVLILRVNNNLTKATSRFLKRSFDIFGSLAITIVLSPVLVALILLIMLDGGPAFFSHERIGQNGKKFNCLKFRSMILNSHEALQNLLDTDADARAEWEKDFKLKDDPRITRIGRFIRSTSLDELPQLWNVLKGEMSLVGPRPVIEEELVRYAENLDYYLLAKPGMTGLWQVSGRNDVDYDTRVYFDVWYVKNWSLWNDIAILFKTVKAVRHRNGAY
ncbi:undecaprenyl-phosphate galactose phosphotransferase WbaP [Pusillimonas sp.]|uniref:undecaprenyl-phosphate galactose phosphotransferase WbaP n=1 Tax=Pusillimonas sp. TaxID=3040095 RepID=UPI0029B6673E|nr:undecaprenyl-phosphate galactose phosphotransferase WbaP [Pusillimonas sp.]MDX3895318.1 undecaprenyl-phosphate galactose phosphotransferase WbaP [Pusillimonas sp.]